MTIKEFKDKVAALPDDSSRELWLAGFASTIRPLSSIEFEMEEILVGPKDWKEPLEVLLVKIQ